MFLKAGESYAKMILQLTQTMLDQRKEGEAKGKGVTNLSMHTSLNLVKYLTMNVSGEFQSRVQGRKVNAQC